MAIGHGRGENKALDAARQALKMPLLDIKSLAQASGLLLHFTGGEDLSLHEVNQAVSESAALRLKLTWWWAPPLTPLWTGRNPSHIDCDRGGQPATA